jgi:BirA family biotin operon repressor/biotin-[acetyl-CoA-carboxylase] ligase
MTKTDLDKLSETILTSLRGKTGLSLETLAKKNEVDLSSVITVIKNLQGWGYRFNITKERVELSAVPDRLIDLEIIHKLKCKTIGKNIVAYQKLKSTNDIASQLADAGEKEGTIIVADEQTKGRGRLGRKWHSPPNTGIYVSIILRPKFKPEFAPGLSIMTAVALADTIDSYIPGKVKIKWPNDILINKKKVSGILTELSSEKDKINFVIVGVGINVNNKVEDFPDELKDIITSIRRVKRAKVNRVEFLQKFLLKFEKEYENYRKSRLKSCHKKIRRYSSLINTEVSLMHNRKKIKGRALDIDKNGALVVEIDGVATVINSGEVTIIKDR